MAKSNKFKRTYFFAIRSAFYLTIISIIIVIASYFLIVEYFGLKSILISIITLFILLFFIIQLRTEHFIYTSLKKIHEKISALNEDNLNKNPVATDIEKLSDSIQNFVEVKHLETKNLTENESFKKDFLGNLAHELKTPLFTIQGYILTLLKGNISDKNTRTKYLERANIGVDRLVDIIKDLDMITKLENDFVKLNYKDFNILELIQNVFDLLEMKAKKRNITLKFDRVYEFSEYARADKEKIEQVLINLIVNSIKYGKPNGTTIVAVDNHNKNKFIVKIIDNGEGIKKHHLPRIFERFYRADQSRSREQGGSGLGLSIVKHVIEAHNETLHLKSIFDEGSEFSFTLEKAKL